MTTTTTTTSISSPLTFVFPPSHSFPPFWTLQPTLSTRAAQFRKWSALILAYCQHQRLFSLTLTDAIQTPLFHNGALHKRLTLGEAREVIDWMCSKDGDGRAEWIGAGEGRGKERAWIWWRSVEEWGEGIREWVEATGQKNTVLTLYELTEGESTVDQDFHGLDPEVLQRALAGLVKRGKAQVFGSADEQGVKFF
ncbi:hypothetical protein MMC34_003792 [Xylographa carneopallida]|nr:hypothetical protein [Xylographa carneopallida]